MPLPDNPGFTAIGVVDFIDAHDRLNYKIKIEKGRFRYWLESIRTARKAKLPPKG